MTTQAPTILLGFCSPGNPRDSHDRCPGGLQGHDCRCTCHTPQLDDAAPTPAPRDPADLEQLDALSDAIDNADEAARWLNTESRAAKHATFPEAMHLLNRLQLLREAVQAAEAYVHRAAWEARGEEYGDVLVGDLPQASVRRTAAKVRWDHDGATKAVIDKHMADTGGEVPDPAAVARWLLDAAAVSYWRKGKLEALDIDPDEYVTSERGTPKITFTRSGPNPLLGG